MNSLVLKYISISLKLISLGLVIAAGSFWAGAEVGSRPKNRDEQTLVAGTVWSQVLIPVGLLISQVMNEDMDVFIQGFFMVSGVLLLMSTALFLMISECNAARRRLRRTGSALQNVLARSAQKHDHIYSYIGVLSLLAGLFTLADFVILLI